MTSCHRSAQSTRRFLPWVFCTCLLVGSFLPGSQAQTLTAITPDSTLGTTVTQTGTVHTIAGGTIKGSNQFHSFSRLSVGANDTASFTGPVGITNILSRVTGGQQSVIDGKLHSAIPQANLYLLNPSGVVFGPHASLDVKGSFHVSTADALRFTDGATFAAHLGTQSSLTVASPAAFGFLGPNPRGIAIRGSTLTVPPGKTLSLVGGDIEIVGSRTMNTAPPNVAAPGGRITLASVASAGEVLVPAPEQTPALDMGAFAQIDIRAGRLDVTDGGLIAAAQDIPANADSQGSGRGGHPDHCYRDARWWAQSFGGSESDRSPHGRVRRGGRDRPPRAPVGSHRRGAD